MIKPQINYENFDKVDIPMTLTSRLLFSFRQFIGNIAKKNSYQNKRSSYLSKSINIPKIHLSNLLSHQIVRSKNSLAKEISDINIAKSPKSLGKEKLDPINGAINQAADMLMDNPENALKYGRYFFLAI